MVLNELWHLKPIAEVAVSFGIDRGIVQNLMGMASIEASCLLKFCEELEEFWAFRELFKNLSQRLSNISTAELVPLMQLPSVKMVTHLSMIFNLRKIHSNHSFLSFFTGTSETAVQRWIQEN